MRSFETDTTCELWRTKEICAFLRIGRNKLPSIVNQKGFPLPFYIGRMRAWRAVDVKEWIDRQAMTAQEQGEGASHE